MLCERCARTFCKEYRNPEPFLVAGADAADAPLLYRGRAAKAIKRYKFHEDLRLCRWFSAQGAACLAGHLSEWQPEMVTYVPLGFTRWWPRGYNQSGAIARRIAKAAGLPCESLLGKRPRHGKQSRRNWEERQRAAAGMFFALPGYSLVGRRVVLVDDIVTTGATASDAVRALREAGASAVFVLALLRTPKGRR